ncbi:type VI secretion system Vgr family protein [Acidimangrovimonas sediminis]|uniref:type VI secretion system Vgr family protein n=1 Tax=Acidimangrovimonas sediminis TaxID=2056283 RepID=UPI000C7FAB0B|nr:type VI secretion system tip protein TssI/VgrG [Acidimangrovimonas sediminis]
MNSIFQQADRVGRLETMLGQDVLVLLRLEGSDHINAPFRFDVDCLATSPDIDFDALLGTHATVVLQSFGGVERVFDGIVAEVRWIGPGENGWRYRLILRPWFWLATLRRNQRIFHEKSVVDILQELLSDYAGAGALETRLRKEYPTLEYTVQYRESDYAFACRMMERFGISYHFEAAEGAHTMVLSDDPAAHASIGSRPCRAYDGHHLEEEEHFWSWGPARRIVTGAVRLTDWNFETPVAAMEAEAQAEPSHAEGGIESFDYPGAYPDQGRGRLVASLGRDREAGQAPRLAAEGDIAALGGGMRVTLGGDPHPATLRGAEYLCLSATHRFVSEAYGTGETESDGLAYSGRYVLLPVEAPMVPEARTPRALVEGPQTAVVVGEDEIDCDKYGRILVRFPWDLSGAISMRCRVSQSWSGGGWGGMVIPRVGMEVVVEFLEGDPDKPLVTGCVYNGKNGVPYDLPANKTRSVFRTDTHRGEGYNELRFEDANGTEEIFVHAQKDMNLEILNDRSKRVGRDQSEMVGADKSIQVGGDHDEVIGGNMSIAVGKNPLSETLMAKTKVLFDGAARFMEKLKIPDPFNFGKGNMQVFVEKNKSEVINLAFSEIVGVAKSSIVGHSFQQTVGKAMSTIVRGRYDTDIGQVMNIRVGEQFTIKVGENSVLTMSKEGDILIEGKSIKLKADDINMN